MAKAYSSDTRQPKLVTLHASLDLGPDGNAIGMSPCLEGVSPTAFVSSFATHCPSCVCYLQINVVVHASITAEGQELFSILNVESNGTVEGMEVEAATPFAIVKEEPLDLMEEDLFGFKKKSSGLEISEGSSKSVQPPPSQLYDLSSIPSCNICGQLYNSWPMVEAHKICHGVVVEVRLLTHS